MGHSLIIDKIVIDSASATDLVALADLLGILFTQEAEFQPSKDLQLKSLRRIVESPEVGRILCARAGNVSVPGGTGPGNPKTLREPKNYSHSTQASDSTQEISANSPSNHSVVGMVSLLFTESTALGAKVALLEDMIVLPEYRACKVGSKLLSAAIACALESGCKRITLLTDQANTQAQHFYKMHGFEQSSMTAFRLLL